jgi:hypothetical protein
MCNTKPASRSFRLQLAHHIFSFECSEGGILQRYIMQLEVRYPVIRNPLNGIVFPPVLPIYNR